MLFQAQAAGRFIIIRCGIIPFPRGFGRKHLHGISGNQCWQTSLFKTFRRVASCPRISCDAILPILVRAIGRLHISLCVCKPYLIWCLEGNSYFSTYMFIVDLIHTKQITSPRSNVENISRIPDEHLVCCLYLSFIPLPLRSISLVLKEIRIRLNAVLLRPNPLPHPQPKGFTSLDPKIRYESSP